MSEWVPWVSLLGTLITVIGGGVFLVINRRGGERARRDPSWKELVDENRAQREEFNQYKTETEERFEALEASNKKRFDELENKVGALTRIVQTTAEQWPESHPIPEFDPRDIEILAHTIPRRFRARPRPAPA